jgi:quinol monooxygenase YgiN
MNAYVLVVEMDIAPGRMAEFLALIARNAEASARTEPGCRQFDVLTVDDQSDQVVFYEVYDDRAAFDRHIEQAHVRDFFAAAKPLIVKQSVRFCNRRLANAKG